MAGNPDKALTPTSAFRRLPANGKIARYPAAGQRIPARAAKPMLILRRRRAPQARRSSQARQGHPCAGGYCYALALRWLQALIHALSARR